MNNDTRKIISALAAHGENGCGLITLSLETGVSQASLRDFVQKNDEYCLPTENHRYKVNRPTNEKVCVEDIIAAIEEQHTEEQIKKRVARAMCWGFILGVVVTTDGLLSELLDVLFTVWDSSLIFIYQHN